MISGLRSQTWNFYIKIFLVLQGHFYGCPAKSPAQTLAGKCEITSAGLGMESKAPQFHGTAWMILSPKHDT